MSGTSDGTARFLTRFFELFDETLVSRLAVLSRYPLEFVPVLLSTHSVEQPRPFC